MDREPTKDFPGKNTGVGCHLLLQGIFPTQGLNPHLLHWQLDSFPLSPPGGPKADNMDQRKQIGGMKGNISISDQESWLKLAFQMQSKFLWCATLRSAENTDPAQRKELMTTPACPGYWLAMIRRCCAKAYHLENSEKDQSTNLGEIFPIKADGEQRPEEKGNALYVSTDISQHTATGGALSFGSSASPSPDQ